MAGNYIMPDGIFINKDCEWCYYRAKVLQQKNHIIESQAANRHYKQVIAQKDRKIRSLEQQVHDWNKVFNSMPGFVKRWALWRYSRLS